MSRFPVRSLTLVLAILLIAVIAWDASERHYNACVTAAKITAGGWGTPADRVRDCSHLP